VGGMMLSGREWLLATWDLQIDMTCKCGRKATKVERAVEGGFWICWSRRLIRATESVNIAVLGTISMPGKGLRKIATAM
jgi:hypothetical protein